VLAVFLICMTPEDVTMFL